jgi:phosphatidylglycerophosphate synthase
MNANIIGKTLGTYGQKWGDSLVRMMMGKGISPNGLKVISSIIYLVGGILLASGVLVDGTINWVHILAGLVMLLASIFDLLNGAAVRISGNATKFGAFSTSIMDHYFDMALFAGALAYFALRHDIIFGVVSSMALVGVMMASYTRARAESLLPGQYDSGYMERPERIVVLVVTCVLNRLYIGMAFIAFFANLATFHRIWDTRQTAFNLEHPQSAGKGYGSPGSPAIVRFFRNLIFWKYPRQTWQHDVMSMILLILAILSLFLN